MRMRLQMPQPLTLLVSALALTFTKSMGGLWHPKFISPKSSRYLLLKKVYL